ncbi:hypothetical protein MANES_10G045366v8 [Manihot esculenta]|uniref:Uncharacterized protein n=1 Tax=Manihot esculenta TaxID=3983 RepID=A0ACC8D0A7_MANES|nr:hypothetical protein MANES_10G045366v8 [Manihot esculenta]
MFNLYHQLSHKIMRNEGVWEARNRGKVRNERGKKKKKKSKVRNERGSCNSAISTDFGLLNYFVEIRNKKLKKNTDFGLNRTEPNRTDFYRFDSVRLYLHNRFIRFYKF